MDEAGPTVEADRDSFAAARKRFDNLLVHPRILRLTPDKEAHMSIFHKAKRVAYHTENSLRGIRRAAKARKQVRRIVRGRLIRRWVRRWDEIDLDVTMTADGVIVGNHWGRPLLKDGFIDPLGKISKQTRIHDLTWAQVKRLHTKDGYKIRRLTVLLDTCARNGIGARIEPKVDKRFEDVETWLPIKAHADKVGAKVKGYSIRNLGGKGAGKRRVDAMNAAGIPSKVIR